MAQIISGGKVISDSRLIKNNLLLAPPQGPPSICYFHIRAQGAGNYMPFPGVLYVWKELNAPPPLPVPPYPSQQPFDTYTWESGDLAPELSMLIQFYELPVYVWCQAYQIMTPFSSGWVGTTPFAYQLFPPPCSIRNFWLMFNSG